MTLLPILPYGYHGIIIADACHAGPVLFLRGDEESATTYPAEEFCRHAGGPAKAVVVPACDHFYRALEDAVAQVVVAWLSRTLGLADSQLA